VASQQGVEMMDLKHTFRHFCSTLRGGGGGGGGGGHAAQFLLTQDNFASAPDLPPIDKAAMVAAYLERHKNSDFGFQVPLVLTIFREKNLLVNMDKLRTVSFADPDLGAGIRCLFDTWIRDG
jgi:hypothetical protein